MIKLKTYVALLLIVFSTQIFSASQMELLRGTLNAVAPTAAECYEDVSNYYKDNNKTCPATGSICDYNYMSNQYIGVKSIRNYANDCRVIVKFKTHEGSNAPVPTMLNGKSVLILPSQTADDVYIFYPPGLYTNADTSITFSNNTPANGATLTGTDFAPSIQIVQNTGLIKPQKI